MFMLIFCVHKIQSLKNKNEETMKFFQQKKFIL